MIGLLSIIAILLLPVAIFYIIKLIKGQQSSTTLETRSTSRKAVAVNPIFPKDLQQMIQSNDPVTIIDVRAPEAFKRGHIKGAININVIQKTFVIRVNKLNRQEKFVLYCQREERSKKASSIMLNKGFRKTYVLDGGILEWEMEDFPIVK